MNANYPSSMRASVLPIISLVALALVGSCSGERGRVHGNVHLERTAVFHVERQRRKRTGLGGGQKKKGDCATCIVQQRARANGAMSLLDMPCPRCIRDPEAQLAPRLTVLRVPMAQERLPFRPWLMLGPARSFPARDTGGQIHWQTNHPQVIWHVLVAAGSCGRPGH